MSITTSSDAILDTARIRARLPGLAMLLQAHAPLWRGSAFREPRLPWEAAYPELARELRALPLATAEALHADPDAADTFIGRFLPVADMASLTALGRWPARECPPLPRGFDRDVPGRKLGQVAAFVAALVDGGLDCVEWCAGKGHLARYLSHAWGHRPVTVLERQPALVASARQLAGRLGLPVTAHCRDVMDDAVASALGPGVQTVALHACGDLHLRLFERAIAHGVPRIACAPCCYHLGASAALSDAARAFALRFEPADLRTAVQETVTAPAHARRQRQRLQAWQLGFDLLQRELRGFDAWLPLPSLPARWLDGDFAAYCREIARRKEVTLPPDVPFARWEAAGRERFREVTALDLVRHCFRRALELWLVFDRACLLDEHGYRVGVATFCARELTPRNLLIQAWRP